MAERKKNPKAEAAMEIAEKFKEIEALATLMRAKTWAVRDLIEADGGGDDDMPVGISTAASLASGGAALHQSIWHNLAYDRGYFETVDVARKMSKTEIDR